MGSWCLRSCLKGFGWVYCFLTQVSDGFWEGAWWVLVFVKVFEGSLVGSYFCVQVFEKVLCGFCFSRRFLKGFFGGVLPFAQG